MPTLIPEGCEVTKCSSCRKTFTISKGKLFIFYNISELF